MTGLIDRVPGSLGASALTGCWAAGVARDWSAHLGREASVGYSSTNTASTRRPVGMGATIGAEEHQRQQGCACHGPDRRGHSTYLLWSRAVRVHRAQSQDLHLLTRLGRQEQVQGRSLIPAQPMRTQTGLKLSTTAVRGWCHVQGQPSAKRPGGWDGVLRSEPCARNHTHANKHALAGRHTEHDGCHWVLPLTLGGRIITSNLAFTSAITLPCHGCSATC